MHTKRRVSGVAYVSQLDRNGCSMASVAMVLGCTYNDMRTRFGDPENGWDFFRWKDVLGHEGYAWQMFWRTDPFTREPRSLWPPQPWAPIHICCVDGGTGDGTHQVVMDRKGVVFDPGVTEPRLLSDYASIAYVAGIFHVGATPNRIP
jgi:hypothetical protein